MKRYIYIAAILITGIMSAQKIAPKHEVAGDLVKSTYYYDNGQISQEGYYKDGKVHGQWVAYDENGSKKSVAEYNKGQKTGTWLFWNESGITTVDYSESRIASVKTQKKDALVNRD